jgi:hypothetical protein
VKATGGEDEEEWQESPEHLWVFLRVWRLENSESEIDIFLLMLFSYAEMGIETGWILFRLFFMALWGCRRQERECALGGWLVIVPNLGTRKRTNH